MADPKCVATVGITDELLVPALKEKGFRVIKASSSDEAIQNGPDFIIMDLQQGPGKNELSKLRSKLTSPIIGYVQNGVSRKDLIEFKSMGANGYFSKDTPCEEVVLRIGAMAKKADDRLAGESRSSHRVWYQTRVDFKVFGESHHAWSTTLSETGIFLRTSLSFPLYTVLQMKFKLWGEAEEFHCDGVVVRQEVEGEVKGLGVMFQNLKGESVRRLESFFEIYK